MHYKSKYLNQENALQYNDGVISIVYFYSVNIFDLKNTKKKYIYLKIKIADKIEA